METALLLRDLDDLLSLTETITSAHLQKIQDIGAQDYSLVKLFLKSTPTIPAACGPFSTKTFPFTKLSINMLVCSTLRSHLPCHSLPRDNEGHKISVLEIIFIALL
ncbi:hypothetical protein XENOCAPTIV_008972 [Xenoophorus captivus]|uniref:Uncharacterized protein n=1 Tax=Xenoophorus captivus TaxID=1517983 RepID=A0ABV0Q9L6_9TELE